MSCEHHHNCGGHEDEIHHDHLHAVGSLCLQGACDHYEHQAMALPTEALMHEQLLAVTPEVPKPKTVEKKRKKKLGIRGFSLLQLVPKLST